MASRFPAESMTCECQSELVVVGDEDDIRLDFCHLVFVVQTFGHATPCTGLMVPYWTGQSVPACKGDDWLVQPHDDLSGIVWSAGWLAGINWKLISLAYIGSVVRLRRLYRGGNSLKQIDLCWIVKPFNYSRWLSESVKGQRHSGVLYVRGIWRFRI